MIAACCRQLQASEVEFNEILSKLHLKCTHFYSTCRTGEINYCVKLRQSIWPVVFTLHRCSVKVKGHQSVMISGRRYSRHFWQVMLIPRQLLCGQTHRQTPVKTIVCLASMACVEPNNMHWSFYALSLELHLSVKTFNFTLQYLFSGSRSLWHNWAVCVLYTRVIPKCKCSGSRGIK